MVRVTRKVTLNGTLLAKNNRTVLIEGKNYFPPESVNMEYLKKSDTKTTVPGMGELSYYDIVIDGEVSKDAACYFAETNPEALKKIGKDYQNYILFGNDTKEEVSI
ncbi:DUF427 domain-containing protein [Methanolobus sp. ZRKC3]|uniref:DUF427 domain-containing protein n=1 Tax=Methanolobus sp. ZRKC3 TaxID=3125786 RepID=UPI003255D8FD